VRLLLDTHAVLWWLLGKRLAKSASERLADPSVLVVVSAVSIWEAGIKSALGKLSVPESLARVVPDEGFQPLPITFEHAERAAQLPEHHRDPFDRMLVAQAQLEGLTIVTRDSQFQAYGVPVLAC
jgi:PIN domain nuclease of toxin-antitoxin system